MRRALLPGFLVLMLAANASALTWEAGLLWGSRSLKDASLGQIFKGGSAYTAYLAVEVVKGGSIGLSYEGGYSRQAPVGLFGDLFQLSVRQLEIFYRQEWSIGAFSPFVKLGPGLAFYQININTPVLSAYNSKGNDISFAMSAGVKVRLTPKIFLMGEIKYGALWIDPFDDKVDLGGVRIQAGAGIRL